MNMFSSIKILSPKHIQDRIYGELKRIKKMKYLVSIEESIKDILLTPLGSRVMLPEYGSRLFELVDRRVDDEFRSDFAYYVISAINRWEKRVRIKKVLLKSFENNKFSFSLVLDDNRRLDYDF